MASRVALTTEIRYTGIHIPGPSWKQAAKHGYICTKEPVPDGLVVARVREYPRPANTPCRWALINTIRQGELSGVGILSKGMNTQNIYCTGTKYHMYLDYRVMFLPPDEHDFIRSALSLPEMNIPEVKLTHNNHSVSIHRDKHLCVHPSVGLTVPDLLTIRAEINVELEPHYQE